MLTTIVGRRLVEVDVGQFSRIVAGYERVTVDVGTGDGRAVLAAATREPRVLAIGLDAVSRPMAEASRRTARSARKGGSPNALFLVAAVEAIPAELTQLATLVTVRFPWASLLRGCLGADAPVAAGIAALPAAGGVLELLLAPADRDGLGDLPTEPGAIVDAAIATFEAHGLCRVEAHDATADEIRASGSTWARRLLSGPSGTSHRRPVVIRFERPERRRRRSTAQVPVISTS